MTIQNTSALEQTTKAEFNRLKINSITVMNPAGDLWVEFSYQPSNGNRKGQKKRQKEPITDYVTVSLNHFYDPEKGSFIPNVHHENKLVLNYQGETRKDPETGIEVVLPLYERVVTHLVVPNLNGNQTHVAKAIRDYFEGIFRKQYSDFGALSGQKGEYHAHSPFYNGSGKKIEKIPVAADKL